MKIPGTVSMAVVLLCVFIGFAPVPGDASASPAWTTRSISEEELLQLEKADPELDINTCREILSRLNTKESFYIRDDIRGNRKLKVPVDFKEFKNWTPLPGQLAAARGFSKFILVVKEIPFIGWYESGILLADSQACIGDSGQDTKPGFYRIQEKDADHVSKSYPNDFGKPAWMPFSLRIYETVWIHAGNVFGARCSHGCVILPVEKAEILFRWADTATGVLVVESLKDVPGSLDRVKRF